mmetsp:Transcript_9511/g.30411  ORF Transcript_9511/g.30411 Transcript_9511/m.30411 type:complete len:268 (+) Transcript_9511:1182-1985(+)
MLRCLAEWSERRSTMAGNSCSSFKIRSSATRNEPMTSTSTTPPFTTSSSASGCGRRSSKSPSSTTTTSFALPTLRCTTPAVWPLPRSATSTRLSRSRPLLRQRAALKKCIGESCTTTTRPRCLPWALKCSRVRFSIAKGSTTWPSRTCAARLLSKTVCRTTSHPAKCSRFATPWGRFCWNKTSSTRRRRCCAPTWTDSRATRGLSWAFVTASRADPHRPPLERSPRSRLTWPGLWRFLTLISRTPVLAPGCGEYLMCNAPCPWHLKM